LQRYSPINLCDGAQMEIFCVILGPVFSASRVQRVSDMHLKFALSHTMCGSMVDIQSATAVIRRGKEIEELECGPMPNLMVALPNIGGALCSAPQSLADAHCLTAVQ